MLLNSKANDSLSYYLKKKQLVKSISAGIFASNKDVTLFQINCVLTTQGYDLALNVS